MNLGSSKRRVIERQRTSVAFELRIEIRVFKPINVSSTCGRVGTPPNTGLPLCIAQLVEWYMKLVRCGWA
eukprot:6153480-Pleurochrysis_carterae.AAC.1